MSSAALAKIGSEGDFLKSPAGSHHSFSKYYYRRTSQSYRFDCSKYIPLQLRVLLRTIQGTKWYLSVVLIFTLYSLFAFDFNLWVLPPKADFYIMIGNFIVLSFFVIDMVICVLCRPKYPLSQFFWLDLITILSLVLEVIYYFLVDTTISVGSLTRATRAAKLGSRIGRMMRLSKVLLGYWEKRKLQQTSPLGGERRDTHSSKVRKKFYQLIIFKVVLLVCILQIVVSLLGSAATSSTGGDLTLYMLGQLAPLKNSSSPYFISQFSQYITFEKDALFFMVCTHFPTMLFRFYNDPL